MGMPVRVPASDLSGLGQTEERTPVHDENAERLKAERKAQRRARYLANREQILAQAKADRAANPERQRAYAKRPEAHKEQRSAYHRAYYAANREKRLADIAANRAARRAAKSRPNERRLAFPPSTTSQRSTQRPTPAGADRWRRVWDEALPRSRLARG